MRMAAVFVIATSTILLRARIAPRWLIVAGYAIALVLLVAVNFSAWIELAFPAWVFVLSLHILLASFRREPSRLAALLVAGRLQRERSTRRAGCRANRVAVVRVLTCRDLPDNVGVQASRAGRRDPRVRPRGRGEVRRSEFSPQDSASARSR